MARFVVSKLIGRDRELPVGHWGGVTQVSTPLLLKLPC